MKLYLYNIQDSNNVINKTLENAYDLDIILKRDVNIINPELILSTLDNIDYSNYNYAHIPELKRYYFIDQVINLNYKLWQLNLECDVLESFKNDILNSNAVFNRGIKSGDYIESKVDLSSYTQVEKHISLNPIEYDENLIMITVGV